MYAPGKIIRVGGGNPAFANTAVVDMNASGAQWRQVAPMNHARRRHNLTLLADGSVMAIGGTARDDDPSRAIYEGEIWDPSTETWTLTAAMTNDRMYHSTALLLPDGRVLVSGGEYAGRLNAQMFSPPYLFKGARPAITSSPGSAAYGTGFTIGFTSGASSITSVALIRPGAVTHAFDHNQRYVPLAFSESGGIITATAPDNANIAPPGFYMLVIKNDQGVPSVATWLRVGSSAHLVPGTIVGKVTDSASGAPIEGATITYSGGTTTSDPNGDYAIADVPVGVNVVGVAASSYAPSTKSQLVTGGGAFTLDFALAPPGAITGKVTDSASGAPIEGATITYSGGTTTSDPNGDYTITNIPSGNTMIAASAETYNSSAQQMVAVPANDSVTVDFTLTRKRTYILGEVRDSATNLTLAGAIVSTGASSATTDAHGRYEIDATPGTYTVTVALNGYVGAAQSGVVVTPGAYSAADFALDPTDPTLAFAPVADAYTSDVMTTNNYGVSSKLRLDTSSAENFKSYLRFNVTGLTGQVKSAKLQLYVINESPLGGAIYSVANTYQGTTTPWIETGLTYNNAPLIGGAALSSAGPAALGAWVTFDVTSAITGNGAYALGLEATSNNMVEYNSREGGNPPQLVIRQTAPLPPTISSFTPDSGATGAEVTIDGSNFIGVTGVAFNGLPANGFIVDSTSRIRAVVPAGATSGKIGITTAVGPADSATDFVVIAPSVEPAISGFTPASGPAGTEVTINGANFTGVTGVTFNGAAASQFAVDTAARIRAVVPASATTGKIGVIAAAGAAVSATNFEVTVQATISGFTPASGPAGTEVTINGANFTGVTGVTFNGVSASQFAVDSVTRIRAIVPTGTTTGKIGVTTTGGSASSAANFQVTMPQHRIYVPLIRTGAAAASTSSRGEYTVLGDIWRTSGPFGYCRVS
jgi:hypothetical protein